MQQFEGGLRPLSYYVMIMRKSLWVIIIVAFIICCWNTGCTEKAKTTADTIIADSLPADTIVADTLEELIAETPLPKAADELFDDFIFNFASNQKVQLSRVAFPLSIDNYGRAAEIEKDNWQMDHFFMTQGYYTIIFDNEKQMLQGKSTKVDTVTIEKIFLEQKSIKQYFFHRKQGVWTLAGIRHQHLKDNPNAQFLTFYEKFATDSAYQNNHLSELITFTGPDPDDDFSNVTGTLEAEQWPSFAPELPHGFIYNIIYGRSQPHSKERIFVLRGIANGLETELTFALQGNEWMLTKLVE